MVQQIQKKSIFSQLRTALLLCCLLLCASACAGDDSDSSVTEIDDSTIDELEEMAQQEAQANDADQENQDLDSGDVVIVGDTDTADKNAAESDDESQVSSSTTESSSLDPAYASPDIRVLATSKDDAVATEQVDVEQEVTTPSAHTDDDSSTIAFTDGDYTIFQGETIFVQANGRRIPLKFIETMPDGKVKIDIDQDIKVIALNNEYLGQDVALTVTSSQEQEFDYSANAATIYLFETTDTRKGTLRQGQKRQFVFETGQTVSVTAKEIKTFRDVPSAIFTTGAGDTESLGLGEQALVTNGVRLHVADLVVADLEKSTRQAIELDLRVLARN